MYFTIVNDKKICHNYVSGVWQSRFEVSRPCQKREFFIVTVKPVLCGAVVCLCGERLLNIRFDGVKTPCVNRD